MRSFCEVHRLGRQGDRHVPSPRLAMLAALMVSTAMIPQQAYAQSSGAAPADAEQHAAATSSGSTLQDIVVTARRRSESISKTPMSIVALTTADMAAQQIVTETDIQRSVPGVTVRQGLSQNQINYSIRGQTIDSYSSSPPGVLPYVNDVQISTSGANAFFDLESIQILKGPQGTLFGRNTTGGAVLFATRKPTFEFGGEATVRFGDYDDRGIRGAINIPLVADTIALRIAGDYHRRDGYVKNIYAGPEDPGRRDLGAIDTQSIRASLLIRPAEGIENITVFQYGYTGGTNLGGQVYSVYACGTPGLVSATDCLYSPAFPAFNALVAANPGIFPGGLSAFLQHQKELGLYKVEYNSPSFFRQKAPYLTNTTSIDVNSDLTIKNIFGWGKSNTNYSTDIDGTPYGIDSYGNAGNITGQPTKIHQISNEFQIQGKAIDGRLDYIIGLYYSRQKTNINYRQCVFDVIAFPCNSLATEQTDTSKAVFGQVTYELAEGLKLTGGVRYTWEKIVSHQLQAQFVEPGDTPSMYDLFPQYRTLVGKYDNPSWTASIEYQATPELLLYGTQRGSWRTGGLNGFAPPIPGLTGDGGSEFLPETTIDFEVGAKFSGRLSDRPFRLRIAGYTQQIKDVQRTVFVSIAGGLAAVTASVPKAKVSGFEIDGQYSPADWLRIGGALSYADARFTSNVASFLSGGVLSSTAFGPYPDTPKWSGSVFGEIVLPMPSELGEATLRADYYGQTSTWFSSTGATISPGTKAAGYEIVNLRLGWTDIGGSTLNAAIFANNVFDKGYFSGGLQTGTALGLNTAIPGTPRMIGAEIGFSF